MCEIRNRRYQKTSNISDEWIFVSMVIDPLFLIIFSVLNVVTFLILVEAPSLYSTRLPMNIIQTAKPLGQRSFILRPSIILNDDMI